MQFTEIVILVLALATGLAVMRFAMLAFLPAHPMSQFMMRLDRLFGATR